MGEPHVKTGGYGAKGDFRGGAEVCGPRRKRRGYGTDELSWVAARVNVRVLGPRRNRRGYGTGRGGSVRTVTGAATRNEASDCG